MSASMRRNTGGAVTSPCEPLAGLRPNMAVGASTGSIRWAASTYCWAEPPMRLAATKDDMIRASAMPAFWHSRPEANRPASVLQVQAQADHVHRPAVAVVGGVDHELVVEGQVEVLGQRQAVVGLEDLLGARMRQLAVAHQDAEPAGVEVALAGPGQAVDHRGDGGGVVLAAPAGAGDRDPGLGRLVDVGVFVALEAPVVGADAAEHAHA